MENVLGGHKRERIRLTYKSGVFIYFLKYIFMECIGVMGNACFLLLHNKRSENNVDFKIFRGEKTLISTSTQLSNLPGATIDT